MARYVKGQHNVICDRCGWKIKSGQARKTWDGLIVCPQDYEPKQPQLTIKPRADRQSVRDARPRQGTVTNADTPISSTNYSDLV